MRLRKVKDAYEKMIQNSHGYFISDGKILKGAWNKEFDNQNPIHIEIGCGKGQFMSQLARKYPDINFIAIEKFDSVLLRALEKVNSLEEKLPNLRLLLADALELGNYFAEAEIERIYLNFSDPWPKTCHAKRRLTSSSFLAVYTKILSKSGEIHQKTDNRHLFEFSLESFNQNAWGIRNISLDLHKDTEKYPDNITTEFEDKWSQLGPIYRLEAYKK